MKNILRVCCLIFAVAVLFSLASCGKEEEDAIPDGFLKAETAGADYEFFYPATWILDRNDAGMTGAYVSETDFSNVSITAFTASGEYRTVAEYLESYYFSQFESNFNNLSVERNQDGTVKKTAITVDGRDALFVNYTADFGGETYRFRATLISENGYIYTLLYTAKDALFEHHLQEADAIVQNLRFK